MEPTFLMQSILTDHKIVYFQGKKRTCSSSQFACDSRNCIPKAWRCDGEPDCLKGTDEVGCAERRCSEIGKFNCSSGKCIDLKYKCDGDDDCGDGSDERNCRELLNVFILCTKKAFSFCLLSLEVEYLVAALVFPMVHQIFILVLDQRCYC